MKTAQLRHYLFYLYYDTGIIWLYSVISLVSKTCVCLCKLDGEVHCDSSVTKVTNIFETLQNYMK